MKAIVKDFLFQSGAHRSMEQNNRFFTYAANNNFLDILIFCQCINQFEDEPGKRKGLFINNTFLDSPDRPGNEKGPLGIPDSLWDILHNMRRHYLPMEHHLPKGDAGVILRKVPLTFSDKVRIEGVFQALKLVVSGGTKPPGDMFREYKQVIEHMKDALYDGFNEKMDYQLDPSITRKIGPLRQCLTEASFNPDYMGIWGG
jgi:hypothetical protein